MATKQFNVRIGMKRDTAANWEQNNPVLLNGEIIIVDTASGEVRFKVGDGTKLYKQLPFSDEAVRALISAKEDKISLTENRAVISDASGKLSVSEVTSTELSYLDGVSSNLQTQIDNKVPTTRKINSKPLSSDITLTATDVDAISAPDGGTAGQLLSKTESGTEWIDPPQSGSAVELDTTLSEAGKAADAKAVGDALAGKQPSGSYLKNDELAGAIDDALAQAKASGEFDGTDGITPTIGANGNWYIGDNDTGKPSRGEQGPGTEVFYIDLEGNYPDYTCPVAMADIKAAYEAGKVLECRCAMRSYTATLPLFVPMPDFNTWIFSGSGELAAMNFDAQSLTIAIVNGVVQASNTRLATRNDKLPNPYKLRITSGDTTVTYDGSTPGNIDIPTALPNPNALTITSGDTTVTYDGSTLENIDIPAGKSAYQYAQEGGYTGTETEFAEKLAQEQLAGTTDDLTPSQVYDAVSAGIPVKVQYTDRTYGLLSFTAFNVAESLSVIVSQAIVYSHGIYILAELYGNKSKNVWGFQATTLAQKTDIPSALPNPNALKFTGAVTGSYNGSAAFTVNIPSAVTDDHINSLIDTKLGVIENGSY